MLTSQSYKETIDKMNSFMFTPENMQNGYNYRAKLSHMEGPLLHIECEGPIHIEGPTHIEEITIPQKKTQPAKINKPYTPFQSDKLFWCFYIILNGYEEYEMNRSSSFSIEKQIKIETVEKLKTIKNKLKELKLKRTELEDELVNKAKISIKGLCALCLVHNVSVTYVYGRKYCEINTDNEGDFIKKGIIIQNEKKEDSLKWTTNEYNNIDTDFLNEIHNEYWFIENIQKPLNAPSYYSVKDLYTICEKLHIETHATINNKIKPKKKTQVYEEILTHL